MSNDRVIAPLHSDPTTCPTLKSDINSDFCPGTNKLHKWAITCPPGGALYHVNGRCVLCGTLRTFCLAVSEAFHKHEEED